MTKKTITIIKLSDRAKHYCSYDWDIIEDIAIKTRGRHIAWDDLSEDEYCVLNSIWMSNRLLLFGVTILK